MFNIIDMPWDWPVEVNYHEAKAYCKWKGSSYRLLTEAEHCRLRGEEVFSDNLSVVIICIICKVQAANRNFILGSPCVS